MYIPATSAAFKSLVLLFSIGHCGAVDKDHVIGK